MIETYGNVVLELYRKRIIPRGSAYDYSGNELEQYYDDFFTAGNDFLQEHAIKQNFPPSYFYFVDNDQTKAYSRSEPEFKIIGIYYPMVEKHFDFFQKKEHLLELPDFENIRAVLSGFNNPMFYSFFQYVQIFIIYHEYAHLIQRGRDATFSYLDAEDGEAQGEDALESHAREQDADWLAANLISHLVLEHFRDDQGNLAGNVRDLTDHCAVALSAVFCFFLLRERRYPNIYFLERDHPHPYARIMWIATQFVIYISQFEEFAAINQREIVNRSFDIAARMLEQEFGADARDNRQELIHNFDQLTAHITKVENKMRIMPFLCYNRPLQELP